MTTAAYAGPGPDEPGQAVVPLRPLGLGEVLDGAAAVVRSRVRTVLGLVAVVLVVQAGLRLVVLLALGKQALSTPDSSSGSTGLDDPRLGAASAVGLVDAGLALVVGLLLAGLVAPVVGRVTLGRGAPLDEVWPEVRGRLGAVVGTALLASLLCALPVLVGAGLLGLLALAGAPEVGVLFVVLGAVGVVAVYPLFCLAPVAGGLELVGPVAAVRRSRQLAGGGYWRIVGAFALTLLVGYLVGQVLQLPFALLGTGDLGVFTGGGTAAGEVTTTQLVFSAFGGLVGSLVVAPFVAAVHGLVYLDRRMRAEAFDLTLRLADAGPGAR